MSVQGLQILNKIYTNVLQIIKNCDTIVFIKPTLSILIKQTTYFNKNAGFSRQIRQKSSILVKNRRREN